MNTRQRAQPTGTNRPTQTHPHPPTPTGQDPQTQGRGPNTRETHRVHYTAHNQPTHHNPPTTTTQQQPPHHNHTTTTTTTPRQPPHAPHHRPLGGHSGEDTPGPIPNPEAKTPSANGTAPNQTRKSRTPPRPHKRWLAPRTQIRGASHLSLPVLSHPEVALNRSSAVRCPGATGRPTKWLTGYLIGRPDARHSARIAPWAFRPCMAPSECVTIAT